MSALDLLDDSFPHGTKAGYDRGCRGSMCPAPLKCREVRARYMGDYAFRKALDGGMTVEAFLAAEVAAVAQERAAAAERVKESRRAMLAMKPTPQRAPKPPRERPARVERAPRPSGPSAERVAWEKRRDELKRRVEVASEVLQLAREELAKHRETRPELTRGPRTAAVPRVPVPRAHKPHGTNASFARGCKSPTDCPNLAEGGISCYQANRDYYREYSRRRQERGGVGVRHGEMKHGTAVGYQYGCRDREACPGGPDGVTCTDAMLNADRSRRRARGVAEKVMVDADPVRAHVARLREMGLTVGQVSERARVASTVVRCLVYGRLGRVQSSILRENAEAILAVQAAS